MTNREGVYKPTTLDSEQRPFILGPAVCLISAENIPGIRQYGEWNYVIPVSINYGELNYVIHQYGGLNYVDCIDDKRI